MQLTEKHLPSPESKNNNWPIIALSPEVYNTFDDEKIIEVMIGELEERGVDPKQVVFGGFDGQDVVKHHSFGERTSTFAVSLSQMLLAAENGGHHSSTGNHSPIDYLEDEDPLEPAIGVFDSRKLLAGETELPRENLIEVTPEMLEHNHDLIYWATKDGSSLDTATVAVFKFNR